MSSELRDLTDMRNEQATNRVPHDSPGTRNLLSVDLLTMRSRRETEAKRMPCAQQLTLLMKTIKCMAYLPSIHRFILMAKSSVQRRLQGAYVTTSQSLLLGPCWPYVTNFCITKNLSPSATVYMRIQEAITQDSRGIGVGPKRHFRRPGLN